MKAHPEVTHLIMTDVHLRPIFLRKVNTDVPFGRNYDEGSGHVVYHEHIRAHGFPRPHGGGNLGADAGVHLQPLDPASRPGGLLDRPVRLHCFRR